MFYSDSCIPSSESQEHCQVIPKLCWNLRGALLLKGLFHTQVLVEYAVFAPFHVDCPTWEQVCVLMLTSARSSSTWLPVCICSVVLKFWGDATVEAIPVFYLFRWEGSFSSLSLIEGRNSWAFTRSVFMWFEDFLLFIFCDTGDWTQGFPHTRPVLYHWTTLQPIYLFRNRILLNCSGWPPTWSPLSSASGRDGITDL